MSLKIVADLHILQKNTEILKKNKIIKKLE